MKYLLPYTYPRALFVRVAKNQWLSWAVVVMSVLICVIITWLHFRQQYTLTRAGLALDNLRQARIDLVQGFLHITLADQATSPFEWEQGLALLEQAIANFEQIAVQLEKTDQLAATFQADVEAFHSSLLQWRATPAPTPAQATALRLTYGRLERQTIQIDALIRMHLQQLTQWLHTIFLWILGGAGLLLAIICFVHHYGGMAKAATEQALHEREAKYRTLFDNMVQGVFYQRADGTIEEVNQAALTMFGLTRDEVLNRTSSSPAWQVIAEDGSPVAATQHPSWLALQTGQPVYQQTLGVFNPAQQRFIWMIISAIPQFKTGATKPYQAFVTLHDITERKAIEGDLRAEKDRFQKIVNTVPGVVHAYRQRADGTISFPYANPRIEEIYGLSAEQLAKDATTIMRLWHPDDVEHTLATIAVSLEQMTTWHAEFRVCHPVRGEIWVEGRSIPQQEADGSILWYGVLTEITDRKVAEAAIHHWNEELEARVIDRTNQLQAANKELEAFSYSVSHDLRAPLRAIAGYTRILVEDYAPKLDSEALRICGIICDEAQRMGQLIDDLLGFSRLGRIQVQLTPLEMTKLASETFAQLVREEQRTRINFKLNSLPLAVGDLAMIRQVWQNLLSNSIKFSANREHALIEVGGTETSNGNIYWVRDNGAGFDMHYVDKLFGVFQRLHSERAFPGTGVGLAIVQRVIHRHGGRVWAEGEVDQGATFSFLLPHS